MKNQKIYWIPCFLFATLMGSTVFLVTDHVSPHKPQASLNTAHFFDMVPHQHASYLYAPGLMGSEIIMGRYCPQFTAVTGEKISWKSGGHVIGQPHTAVIFPEINLKKPKGFTLNPLTAWLNGVRSDLFPLAQRLFGEKYGITVEDNPASAYTVANYSFKFGQANIAQHKDIKALHRTYLEHIEKHPNTAMVLYGDSRGAATIFNYLATHQPKAVKCAVLEGIFDDIPHVIKHSICSDKEQRSEKRLHDILSLVMGSYKKKGPFPRDYAEKITDTIPLLLVTSLKDWIVPAPCTIALYSRLKERGHQKVHLLILKNSSHPCYMLDDAAEKELYESVVHAFYKKYGLPHNRAKATAGEHAFAATQPAVIELKQYLDVCKSCHGTR